MFFETILTNERILREGGGGFWPNLLANDYLDRWAKQQPLKTAIVDARSRYSYAELRQWVDVAALGFLDRGIRHGDVVTVQLPNWNEYVICALALERIGAVVNPVAFIFRHREMRNIIRLAKSKAIVMPSMFRGFAFPPMYAELAREFPSLESQIVVGPGDTGDGIPWAEFLDRGASHSELLPHLGRFRPDPNDVVELMFTSGTTGEPKGVMHTGNTITAGVQTMIEELEMTEKDVAHMASTLGHQTGFLYGMQATLRIGGRLVLQEEWNGSHFVKLIEAERITYTMGATPFLADTLAAPNLPEHDTSSLRLFLCGGAPIPQPLAEAATAKLSCRLIPVWGMTEVGVITAVTPHHPAEKICTSDGRANRGAAVEVRGEDGKPVAAGVEGELVARGPSTFVGYCQGRAFTEAFFDADGWFTTGDRAKMDSDGFIRICGRSKDLIIRGGENVPVKEVEDVLLRHPKIRTVAVVAVPHARMGEIGCACVIAEPGEPPTLGELCAFLKEQQLTPQFWPEQLLVLAEFPMTVSGKIQKFALREMAAKAGPSANR